MLGKIAKKWNHVLGINCRNLGYVYECNPRKQFVLADSKIEAKNLLSELGVPVPRTIFLLEQRYQIAQCFEHLDEQETFVLKPNQSFGGQGLMVAKQRLTPSTWSSGKKEISKEDILFHLQYILSGMFSMGNLSDQVIVEELLADHDILKNLHGDHGVSDIRVIVYRSRPVMAMLRIPCAESNNAANLHAGGLGVGIDIQTGVTNYAIQHGREVTFHPDTNKSLQGISIPFWQDILDISTQINPGFKMDYLGVDFVLDRNRGPLVLEVNVRPGLAIQLANRKGLKTAIQELGDLS